MKSVKFLIGLFFAVVFISGSVFAAAGSKNELKIAAVMYGHANEGTWDPAAYKGLLEVQEKIPFKLNLSEGTSVQDAENIIRNWAAKGMNVVFAHSLIYTDQLLTVAKHYPDVYFIGEQIMNPNLPRDGKPSNLRMEATPKNVLFMGDTPLQGNYLAGYAAALVSKTGKLGILQPFESPGLNRYSNAFIFGAQAVKPDIKIKIVYIGDYIAPAESRDAVKALANSHCDVVFTELDDNSAILESKAQGIYCIPMYMDKHNVAPKTVLTSVVMGWQVPLGGAIGAVADGAWEEYRNKHYFRPLSVEEGSISLGVWGDDVPESVKKAVEKVESEIKNGTITVKAENKRLIY